MSEKIVVVGAGMVGHRFVDELVRADPAGRFTVELIGAEEYEPYNRILLSEVLAGRADLRALGLPLPDADRVVFRRGVAVDEIDTAGREVLLSDGTRSSYDHLVLATGARAFVPPLPGLAGEDEEPKHVHVLRTLDDTRNIAARAMNAKHAVVLGGGLLGLEAACGLRRRGVPVTVVDLDSHVMATQLDGPPARMLAAQLRSLGIDVITGTSVAEVVSAYGEIVAVRLTDDRLLAADLMLVSCGIRAESGLAGRAGIVVDRGIVVDADLRTSDPHVYAIGDCAQPPSGMTGLLAPGWAQAGELVSVLLERDELDPDAVGDDRPDPVKLKAVGIDLVTMGVRPSQARRPRRPRRRARRGHLSRVPGRLRGAHAGLRPSYAAPGRSAGAPGAGLGRRGCGGDAVADADARLDDRLPLHRSDEEADRQRLGGRRDHPGRDRRRHPGDHRVRRLHRGRLRARRLAERQRSRDGARTC
jgi:assimilatory nitrate reductase electron transfer subunit